MFSIAPGLYTSSWVPRKTSTLDNRRKEDYSNLMELHCRLRSAGFELRQWDYPQSEQGRIQAVQPRSHQIENRSTMRRDTINYFKLHDDVMLG